MSHETVIAKRIVDEAQSHGDVEKVTLALGELGHVPPQELVDCIKELVDWEIDWEEIPAQARCGCGWMGHPEVLERGHDHFMIECPSCGETPELTSGTQFVIKSVVVKD